MTQHNRSWHFRRRHIQVQLLHLQRDLGDAIAPLIPNGQLLILSGAAVIAILMVVGLIMFTQSTGQMESEAFNMMQSVQDPGDVALDGNPLLSNMATGGFALLGLIGLGALLVCLDRLRENIND